MGILDDEEEAFVNCRKLKQADVSLHYTLLYCLIAARNGLNFPTLYAGKLHLCAIKLIPLERVIHADSKYLSFTIL